MRNELPLIKELLPVWSKYADGFVFCVDQNTDDTVIYLNSVKEQYNILEVIEREVADGVLNVETDARQKLFDAARKYSDKIICLDADEYLDGNMTKQELEVLLDSSPNTVFHLQWLQYTSVDTIRVDGPWKDNIKDRIGSYIDDCKFSPAQKHSTHLPIPQNQVRINQQQLFIAHLQWLNKKYVAIKQYYWKVLDYVDKKMFGVNVAGSTAYDDSVNNFNWEEEYVDNLLKISPWVFDEIVDNYRIAYIKEQTKLHDIPNLGDWGYDLTSLSPIPNRYKITAITGIGDPKIYDRFVGRFLENAIDQHFFRQTEHIIVYSEWNDIYNQFLQYPNFKLIQEDAHLGVYNAWNIGIKAATTDYITNWNVDDLRHPINTKIKYDAITKNDYDMIYNWYIATTDELDNFHNTDLTTKTYLHYPDNYETCVMDNCYAGPDPLWKKSLHEQVGYFDYENFSTIGDWEMWARMAKAGARFKLIPLPLCLYLDHDSTVSKTQSDMIDTEKQRLHDRY